MSSALYRSFFSSSRRFHPIQSSFVSSSRKFGTGNFKFNIGRLNHVAIAVPELSSAANVYRNLLGAKVSPVQEVREHGVSVVFVELENTKIELLEPLGESSPIAKFLEQKPSGGIHHVCVEVDDIHKAIEHLKSEGARLLAPEPKIGAHGLPVMFVHPKEFNGVLLELEEVKKR